MGFRSIRLAACFLAGMLFAGPGTAQTRPGWDLMEQGRLPLRVYRADTSGLPSDAVETVLFDREGYFWAGTQQGAVRYNGWRWMPLNMPHPEISNWVRCIVQATEGGIWFGTEGDGFHLYRDGQWTSFGGGRDGFPGGVVDSLLEAPGPDGRPSLWVGTQSSGLWVLPKGGRIQPVTTLPSKAPGRVLALHWDGRALRVGTSTGLYTLREGVWTHADHANSGLPNDTVHCLHTALRSDGEQVLWLGTHGGLARLEKGVWSTWTQADGLPSNTVFKIRENLEDGARGDLWLATGGGIARFRNGRFQAFGEQAGLPNLLVQDLIVHRPVGAPQTLWLATNGGLTRVQPSNWISFQEALGNASKQDVFSLLETQEADGSPVFWVGTAGQGLLRFNKGAWSSIRAAAGHAISSCYALLETRGRGGQKEFWVGTRDEGLFLRKGDQWRWFHKAHGFPDDRVYCLAETRDAAGRSTVWAGTRAGLAAWNGEAWRIYTSKEGLPGDIVDCLQVVPSSGGGDTLWVGTRNGGISRLEGDHWTTFGADHGLQASMVACLALRRDAAGHRVMWAGTAEAGLWLLDLDVPRPTWIRYDKAIGLALPSLTIYAIREDALGRIYLFTGKGVVRLRTLSPAPKEGLPFEVHHFTTADGLPNNDMNQGSTLVDSKGRLWVGTPTGVAAFDPSSETSDRQPKPLRLEAAIRLQEGLPLKAGMSLSHKDNRLRFEWALLSFLKEEGTAYRTHLAGLEAEPSGWSPTTTVEYPRLPAGPYVFRVWGRDHAGNLSGPLELAFVVRRAPWLTPWAFLAYVVGGSAGVFGLVQRRTRMLAQRNRELEAGIRVATAELAESEQRAQEANRAKSAFLANMSHELRTPMNAILGFAELMAREPGRSLEDKASLERILRAGEHLLVLINDVLSISKIEAGRLVLNPRPFETRLLLKGLEEMLRPRAQAKDLALDLSLAPDFPETLLADDGKLRQVLLNLLGNALKFTEHGSVTLRGTYAEGRATFTVADTGPGIPKADMDRLFDAFHQTETGLQSQEGTGLGLHISHSMVALMGGELQAESEVGRGTTFRFWIHATPAPSVPVLAPSAASMALEAGQPLLRMLVADDREDNRVLLSRLFESVGFQVRTAEDGQEAVELWSAWGPDVVWMDMRMPRMDGLEAVQAIRQREADLGRARTLVVALTASVFDQNPDLLREAGFDEYVAKPFQQEQLFQLLTRHRGVRFRATAPPEEAVQGLAPADLAGLDPAWRQALGKAAALGDQEEALRLVQELAPGPLARNLETLIRGYRLQELRRLLG